MSEAAMSEEQKPVEDDERTVVRPRLIGSGEVSDETVVRPLAAALSDASEETVVRPRPSSVDDQTRVSGAPASPSTEKKAEPGSHIGSESAALDPRFRASGAPETAPWELLPEAERGVRPGLPVVYGARHGGSVAVLAGPDEISRQIGRPPAATSVPVREGRAALVSVARRTRRVRVAVLGAYALVIVIAGVGLWGVAKLAFG